MNGFFAKKWPPFLLLGIATLLVWGQTVTFKFVWDDDFFIRDLPSVRSLRHVPEMFYRLDAQSTLPDKFDLFRPIRTAAYAVLHFLDGQNVPQPWIYHLANVLGHGATAMMLFAALALLLPRWSKHLSPVETRFWAFVIALIFAVHPVVSEVVCWAKSLDDILAAFFTLAALRELLLAPENSFARWRGLLFFALAVYSKESAVPFAMIAFLITWKFYRLPWKESATRTAGFFIIAFVYVVHRHLVIGRSSQTEPISGSYTQTLLDMLPVVPEYFRLLLGIPPFCIDYSYLQGGHHFFSPAVLGGLVLLLTLIGCGMIAGRIPGLEAAGFGLSWTGIFLLPVANLVPMMQYMAERFLYLPLIGWLIALVVIVSRLPRQKVVRAGFFALILLWAAIAWNRSWIWQDRVTLFVRSSQENPPTQRVEDNAVAAILELPAVRQFFNHDTSGKKNYAPATVDTRSGQLAVATLAEAHRLFPTNPVVLSYYGMSLAIVDQPQKALPLFEEAAASRPEVLDYRLNLARAALAVGQTNPAIAALEKADALAPNDPDVLQLRFKLFWQTQNYPAARETLQRLNKIRPSAENEAWLSELEKLEKTTAHHAEPETKK